MLYIFFSLNLTRSAQAEPPAVPGGDAGRGERRRAGGHAVGDPDVPVPQEGRAAGAGQAAAPQLN